MKKFFDCCYKLAVIIFTLFTLTTISLIIILIFNFGKNDLGWFDSYEGWHKEEILMPEPLKGGTIYIPNEWSIKVKDDWLIIIDDEDNIIGIQIYKGYYWYDIVQEEIFWENYEENPTLGDYNFDYNFGDYDSSTGSGSNNCLLKFSEPYYILSFSNMCLIENNPREHPSCNFQFLMVGCSDFELLDKIRRSYSWGGYITGIY